VRGRSSQSLVVMDAKVVAIVVGSGVVMGLFVKPRAVAYLGIGLFAAAILGMMVSAAIGRENWIFLFAAELGR
jgi:hypothetical protein